MTPSDDSFSLTLDPQVRALYSRATVGMKGTQPPEKRAVTMLHIDDDQVIVATGDGRQPSRAIVLALGSVRTSRELFHHDPPTPLEMENAITATENEVIRARAIIDAHSELMTNAASIKQIARFAGLSDPGQRILSIRLIERAFESLAAVTLGRPASIERVPAGTAFAAALLILREFMHHLQFTEIILAE